MSVDGKDAARYRWLREQFTVSSAEEIRRGYTHLYVLKDPWRFGVSDAQNAIPPSFDDLVDVLMTD